jgi:pimeloyl-ACP methyl ester carboxylesterase
MVDTTHGSTFVRISGPADGPPLVLLPGGGTNSLIWRKNISSLAAQHRVYALDSVLDVGRSLGTSRITTVDELVDWLHQALEGLGLRGGVNLLGLSHGGWLAAHYAKRHPERLARLVLLAPAGWVLPLDQKFILGMLQMLLWPRRFFIRRVYRASLPDLVASGPAGLELIEEMTQELALAFESFGVRRLARQLDPRPVDDEGLRLAVPTLFVVGEHESIYDPVAALARLTRVAPEIEQAVISGAGHEMTWLKPEAVHAAVLGFLGRPARTAVAAALA